MMEVLGGITAILGVGNDLPELSSLQLIARAVLLYLVTLVVIRLARNRFVGESIAFDVVLGFILGSTLLRALDGDNALFQTVIAAGVMLVVHWAVRLASERGSFEDDAPSSPVEEALAQSVVGQAEPSPSAALIPLQQRSEPRVPLQQRSEPRVLEVQVADGVQTVRIAIG